VWDFSGATKLDVLHTKLRQNGMLRRLKSEVLTELPPKARYVVLVELSNKEEYDRAEDDFISWYNEQLRLKRGLNEEEEDEEEEEENQLSLQAEAIVRMGALLQLEARGKLKDTISWITDRLDGSDEKIVVYAWHKDIQQALFDAFNTPEYCAVKIFGGETSNERDAAVQQFQHNTDVRVIVCSIASAGFGVTLTASSNLVMVESTWTPGEDEQVEDRIYRIGQANGATIWYMISGGTIGAERFEAVDRKRGDFTQAMDGERKSSGASVASDVMKKLAKKGKKA
jgi:SWI/SNF-related matrix-associated actin-dependent regulator 1 of chromatin subfamily A